MRSRLHSVAIGVGAAALAVACASSAGAQDYASQRIAFVVGFAAGGFADSVARIVGDHVSKTLGQPVLVENRSGAASNIAARAVASARRMAIQCWSAPPHWRSMRRCTRNWITHSSMI
jgi:tripartite-type tricarboxylate transporter receptor subunit TctC